MTDSTTSSNAFRIRVDINGKALLWFSEVTGFDMNARPGETHVDYDAPPVHRLPGRYKLGNVALKRGLTGSEEMLAWMRSVREGRIVRKSLTITMLDEQGAETGVWQVNNCWPVKYSASAAKGENNEVMIETLELAHEGLIRSR